MRLEDRTAVVTGGSSGIGRGIALAFAEEGANVVVADIREDPLDEGAPPVAEEIRESGGDAAFVETDVTDAAQCEALVEATVDAFGGLDVLVNNAGGFPDDLREKTIEEIEEDDWDRVLDVELKAHYRCAKAAIPYIRESEAGRIINMASLFGFVGTKETLPYSAAKGGVLALTKQLAAEYAEDGVTVNALAPGVIITGTYEFREDKPDYGQAGTPLPYLGEPKDVAAAALFLAGDSGRFVTGQRIVLDGGYSSLSLTHTGAES